MIGNSPTKNSFSSNLEATTVAGIYNVGLDGESESSVGRAFFEEERLTAIDLGKCSRCLS